MLLVLIALAVATIVSVSFLASRDNSASLGANISNASEARTAALSTIDLGASILQATSGWRTQHVNGRLLDQYPIGNAQVDLDLIDVATGSPPTAATEVVELTATAHVEGITQAASAIALVDGTVVDVDLTEFAVFATTQLSMSSTATLGTWETAPMARVGTSVAIGTQSSDPGAVHIRDSAAAIDSVVYTGPNASSDLVLNTDGPPIDVIELQDTIPMPAATSPPTARPAEGTPSETQIGGSSVVTTDMDYTSLFVQSAADMTVQGNVTLTVRDDFAVKSSAAFVVDGHVDLVVYGDMIVIQGDILLTEGSTLRVFIGGTVAISQAYLGDGPTVDTDTTGNARWMDVQRFQMISIDDGAPNPWMVINSSVLKTRIYAPAASSIQLASTSTLYGAAATDQLVISDDASLFYDPALSLGLGYTDAGGLAFQADGRIRSPLMSLAALNDWDIQTAANSMRATLSNGVKRKDSTVGMDAAHKPNLRLTYTSAGGDTDDWEQ